MRRGKILRDCSGFWLSCPIVVESNKMAYLQPTMVVVRKDTIALSAIFESLKILDRIKKAEEVANVAERKRQEEILASYQSCARKLLRAYQSS